MANSVISMITSITFIVLFTIAILGFSVGFANDNNAAIRIDGNSSINSLYGEATDSMGHFSNESDSTYSSIVDSKIEAGSDVIKSPAAFTLTWINLFTIFGTIMKVIYVEIFGANPAFAVFTTTLITIIGITFTLYIIKAWRGNP